MHAQIQYDFWVCGCVGDLATASINDNDKVIFTVWSKRTQHVLRCHDESSSVHCIFTYIHCVVANFEQRNKCAKINWNIFSPCYSLPPILFFLHCAFIQRFLWLQSAITNFACNIKCVRISIGAPAEMPTDLSTWIWLVGGFLFHLLTFEPLNALVVAFTVDH